MLALEDYETVFISLDGTMPWKELEKILARAVEAQM